ncbi:MAG: hypothetical protein GY791_13525 [Alphaproteobacteria bacterium]|nr:hypothetical protein [Alphaproteobacteria bacterium]
MSAPGPERGAILRLFGVVLLFLSALDFMLSWRAGLAVDSFYIFLFGAGVLFYALGAIRREGGPRRRPDHQQRSLS